MSRYIMDTAEFIRRSIEVHGDKYGYDKAVYVGQGTKVTIYCRACQKDFEQAPRKHYAQGEGCWDCGVAKRQKSQSFTFDEFVAKARAKHGNQYTYDRTSYVCAKTKLTIGCLVCAGTFEQQGNSHLQGTGCPQCSIQVAHAKQSYGREGFLERARAVHGDKFQYISCTDPNWNQKSFVTWKCTDCEVIREQLVLNHLAGKACARCSNKEKHTTESFINKSMTVHGKDRYDYSEVAYVTNRTHVWITCHVCELRFSTKPDNHMTGKECPRCVAKRFVSLGETAWLDSLGIDLEHRNVHVSVGGRNFNVDALVGNMVYEYNGDYYHGNPAKHKPDQINHKCGLTMRELYNKTLEKQRVLEAAGYAVVSMWESDWKRSQATSHKRTSLRSMPNASSPR